MDDFSKSKSSTCHFGTIFSLESYRIPWFLEFVLFLAKSVYDSFPKHELFNRSLEMRSRLTFFGVLIADSTLDKHSFSFWELFWKEQPLNDFKACYLSIYFQLYDVTVSFFSLANTNGMISSLSFQVEKPLSSVIQY